MYQKKNTYGKGLWETHQVVALAQMVIILQETVSSRGVFRTQSNMYDAVFLRK